MEMPDLGLERRVQHDDACGRMEMPRLNLGGRREGHVTCTISCVQPQSSHERKRRISWKWISMSSCIRASQSPSSQ